MAAMPQSKSSVAMAPNPRLQTRGCGGQRMDSVSRSPRIWAHPVSRGCIRNTEAGWELGVCLDDCPVRESQCLRIRLTEYIGQLAVVCILMEALRRQLSTQIGAQRQFLPVSRALQVDEHQPGSTNSLRKSRVS